MSMPQDSFSSYQDYPSRQPLTIDEYTTRKSTRAISAAPESNSRAVISALLGLQDKIRRLEDERAEAEGNLKLLANETTHYRDSLQKQDTVKKTAQMPTSKHSQELQSQLAQAETRSQLLEKQLEYMRNMVRNAEHQRNSAIRQKELQNIQEKQVESEQTAKQCAKIDGLEREHAKMKVTQAMSESKIHDLENKVKEEKHKREVMQSRAAQLQTVAETQKILPGSCPSYKVKKVKTTKKKATKTKPSSQTYHSKQPNPNRHLRLQMENVPFVAGKATTPSHNVNVNMQNLIAMMKTHNSAWCGNASQRAPHLKGSQSRKSHCTASVASNDSDLSDLLLGLQDEFGQLAFEHQEISKQIQETTEGRLQDDLEQERSHVLARMEAKGDQISKLKRHKQKIAKKTSSKKLSHKIWSSSSHHDKGEGEVKVITTVKTQGAGIKTMKVVSPDPKRNHRVLHSMKTLQTSLHKDDVSWE